MSAMLQSGLWSLLFHSLPFSPDLPLKTYCDIGQGTKLCGDQGGTREGRELALRPVWVLGVAQGALSPVLQL